MNGSVFLTYQTMCDGCPYKTMIIFLKLKHCAKCEKKKQLNEKI